MGLDYNGLKKSINHIKSNGFIERIENIQNNTYSLDRFNTAENDNAIGQKERIKFIESKLRDSLTHYSDNGCIKDLSILKGNIENFIGFSKIPTGLIGPLLIHGTKAEGPCYIPLATTEGALVASYNRGAKAATEAGGIRSVCISERVQRSPLFRFKDIIEVGKFISWIVLQYDKFTSIASENTNYGKLINMKTNIEGNQVNLVFEYTTGDASGQNMVTFCTYEICKYIVDQSPIKPVRWYVESNYSGDKKANYQSFQSVRGKKVIAEVEIPQTVVAKTLKSTPEAMVDYWTASTLSLMQIGSIGAQGHIANGLTALFIATGQDVACISEVAIAINRFEITDSGNLYVSLTMPNLIVGTVGGGTALPTQKEALQIMDCFGEGNSNKFAEICCALALSGELSIAAAIASGHFVSAHRNLGR